MGKYKAIIDLFFGLYKEYHTVLSIKLKKHCQYDYNSIYWTLPNGIEVAINFKINENGIELISLENISKEHLIVLHKIIEGIDTTIKLMNNIEQELELIRNE